MELDKTALQVKFAELKRNLDACDLGRNGGGQIRENLEMLFKQLILATTYLSHLSRIGTETIRLKSILEKDALFPDVYSELDALAEISKHCELMLKKYVLVTDQLFYAITKNNYYVAIILLRSLYEIIAFLGYMASEAEKISADPKSLKVTLRYFYYSTGFPWTQYRPYRDLEEIRYQLNDALASPLRAMTSDSETKRKFEEHYAKTNTAAETSENELLKALSEMRSDFDSKMSDMDFQNKYGFSKKLPIYGAIEAAAKYLYDSRVKGVQNSLKHSKEFASLQQELKDKGLIIAIENIRKKFSGGRGERMLNLYYSFFCEFVHPNFGSNVLVEDIKDVFPETGRASEIPKDVRFIFNALTVPLNMFGTAFARLPFEGLLNRVNRTIKKNKILSGLVVKNDVNLKLEFIRGTGGI